MSKKIFSYIMVSLLLLNLLTPGYVMAADDDAADDVRATYQMSGTVTEFSDTRVTINEEGDSEGRASHTFIINEETKIKGKISEGTRVTISYKIRRLNKKLARLTAIEIRVAGADKEGK